MKDWYARVMLTVIAVAVVLIALGILPMRIGPQRRPVTTAGGARLRLATLS